MRALIVLCLSAVAFAAPQGYNYQPAAAPIVSAGGIGFASPSLFSTQPAIGGGAFQQAATISAQHIQHQHQTQPHQQTLVSKRFLIHTAPEDAEESYQEKHLTVGVPRKNYNVVFIKSSQNSQRKSAIKITPAVNEEKTVIYVLKSNNDNSDIDAQVLEQAAPVHKPEVFFIKYKTAEEASHAQQKIQAQYDALGGNTQITDEGIARVSSVIGSLGGDAAGSRGVESGSAILSGSIASGGYSQGANGGGAVSNSYLPANFH